MDEAGVVLICHLLHDIMICDLVNKLLCLSWWIKDYNIFFT